MSLNVSTVTAAQAALADQRTAPADKPQAQPRGDTMQTEPPVSMDTVIAELGEVSAAFAKRLSFTMNEKLGQVVVKVIDTRTDKVIREIPPEELQHVHERIREVMGILFDERA